MQNKKWNMPPRIKVLEAAGAVADGRVEIVEGGARVWSSSGAKAYVVRYDPKSNRITSNDNASYYVGYLGYPAIAFLLKTGILPYSTTIGSLFAGVEWKALNSRLKNDYTKLESLITKGMTEESVKEAQAYIDSTMERLRMLDVGVLSTPERPPSGW